MGQKRINIVILNYNGKNLLEKYLPSVLEAAKNSAHACRVSIVDNRSIDDSLDFIRQNYKEVNVYEAKENKVLCSYNDYLDIIDDDIVIFLNNDIKVDSHFVDPLIGYFDDAHVLFVAPKELSLEKKYQGNLNRLIFRLGMFFAKVEKNNIDKPNYNIFVQGGAFDRKKFLDLGGYDNMYLPGIVEDLDLCYRGWKHGWKGIYEPRSFYYHEGSTTFNERYGKEMKTVIAHRNMFLFFWKNVTSTKMLIMHIIFIPVLLTLNLLRGKWLFIRGFFRALGMLNIAIKKRAVVKSQFYITDEEVMRKTRMPYQIMTEPQRRIDGRCLQE